MSDDFDKLVVTQYGFKWGPLTVTRLISDPNFGCVIEVATDSRRIEIRSSAKGRILTASPTLPTEER